MMTASRVLQQGSFHVPHGVLRRMKLGLRKPRYVYGLMKARQGFHRHGHRYVHKYLFVAGLPKSGTSWVESMLAAYPGYALVSHPEVTVFDYAEGGTHRFEMPADAFARLGNALCVVKTHSHGSRNNVVVLEKAAVPYCVMYRDLRDAAVSHVFYVKRTPWHPEYPLYSTLDVKGSLLHFARTLLPEWRDWISAWQANRNPERSIEIRYEDLIADTKSSMSRLAALYQLPVEPMEAIIDRYAFSRMQRGGSFFRKGVAGDWINHFDGEVRDVVKRVIGPDLIRWGYASDCEW